MLKKVIDPATNDSQVFTYTDNGLKASVADAKGNVTSYLYDGFDRLDKTVYPDGTFEQNTAFDGNSNVTSILTRAGDTIGFQFDVLNRMTQKSPDGMPVVTFVYDLAGRLTSVSTPVVTGNLASGEWEYGYDTAGRLTSEEAPDGKTVSYQMDENGNVVRIDYADGYYVIREYDELNRLTGIKLNGSSTPAVEFDYDDLSRRTQMTFDNGVQTDYGYEWNDDMSSIEHAFNGSDLDFAYGFNDAHQLISQTISDNQHSWHPTVDQLLEYQSNELNQYDYASGSCGRLYKGYNANGCLIDDGVWKFGYDTEKYLISADDGTTSVDYVYDPTHRQILKDVDGTKTRYVYAGWQRLADYDGTSDTLQNRYVYGTGLDEPLIKVASGGSITYMHADRLGSIMTLTNDSGVATNRYAYSPWGESNSLSGTSFGFTGQRFDEETGLYYYKNRYYSPTLGVFLQPDPVGYESDLNLYQYSVNDPVNITDPIGLRPVHWYPTPQQFQDYTGVPSWFWGRPNGMGCRSVVNWYLGLPQGARPETAPNTNCFYGTFAANKAAIDKIKCTKCQTKVIWTREAPYLPTQDPFPESGPINGPIPPMANVCGGSTGYNYSVMTDSGQFVGATGRFQGHVYPRGVSPGENNKAQQVMTCVTCREGGPSTSKESKKCK